MNTNHSQLIATLIICLALIGSVLIYDKKEALFAQAPGPKANVVVDNSPFNLQPANDNWKKSLSSVNNPIQIVVSQNSGADASADDTLTGKLSKEFFSLYLADKKAGVTIDQNEALNIANQTINNLNINFQGKQYAASDVQVSQDSSNIAMASYEKALFGAVQTDTFQKNKSPIDIMDAASQSLLDSDLAQLDPVIKGYQITIAKTLAITVPQKALGYHIVYLNTLSDLLYDTQGMRKVLNDPIIGYVAFSTYQKDVATLQVVIDQMNLNLPQ